MSNYASSAFGQFRRDQKWGDPFITPSNTHVPQTVQDALELAEYLFYLNSRYRQANRRVTAHFIQDIEFQGVDKGSAEEQRGHRDLLYRVLGLRKILGEAGEEMGCYGNAFFRIYFPFDRYLIIPNQKLYTEVSVGSIPEHHIKFRLSDMKYECPDPTQEGVPWERRPRVLCEFVDKASGNPDRIKIVKCDPKRFILRWNPISHATDYIYRFEEEFISDVKAGHVYQVNPTPRKMLEAIRDNQYFLFNPDEILHLKAPTVSGIQNGGWGLPETIANYRNIRQIQVYRRIDEAVGLDYMIPFRVFSPAQTASHGGPSDMVSGELHSRFLQQMIDKRRADPTALFAAPFPIAYAEFGASGKSLVPKDLIEFQTNELLDSVGYPRELASGSLTIQTVPTALRLFENSFSFLYEEYARLVQWVSRRVTQYLRIRSFQVQLRRPSMADDLEERNIYLQLAAGQEISRATAFRPFGIEDPVGEAERRIKEDQELEELRMRAKADSERRLTQGSIATQQSGTDSGGAPAGAPGEMTPTGVVGRAEEEARRLLQIPDNGTRAKELQKLRATDENLYAVTKQKMEELRSAGASMGRAQAGDL